MSILDAILLGLLQGLTEFLPVSSSGHLVLGKAFLGIHQSGITFEVFVHFGTLLAVVTYYRRDFIMLLASLGTLGRGIAAPSKMQGYYQADPYFRLGVLMVVATLPTAIIGLLLEDWFESLFNDARLVSFTLLVTAAILFATRFVRERSEEFNIPRALAVGLAQTLAIIPGISRSGSTISMGLFLGVERIEATRFAFLLAIPAIAGATLLKLADILVESPSGHEILAIAAGALAAYVSGYFAIKVLIAAVQRGRFDAFAYYCAAVGITGLIVTSL